MHLMFGGRVYQKKLSRTDFFDAINRTDLDTKSALSAAPVIDIVFDTIGDDGILRTNQTTVVA